MGGQSGRPGGRLHESEVGGHARPKWEAVGFRGGRPLESDVGGHVRPKWEAVGGRSGRPKWEAKVGG